MRGIKSPIKDKVNIINMSENAVSFSLQLVGLNEPQLMYNLITGIKHI